MAVSHANSPKGPKSPELDKNKKYDRQLRLWGDHGQSALEASQVCLINASASGTEILKSLILPGIGSFTIVDGHKVSGEDVGNNFFLTKESVGKSRAQVATELLLELNSDSRGDWVDETAQQLLENNPNFFNNFSVVIATNLDEKTLLDLSSKLWNVGIPLLICRSYGLIGYMRLVIKEHTVIESHPDNSHPDLRVDVPFPALVEYVNSMDLKKMNKKDHSHTPYLIILLKCLEEWKREKNGSIPKTYKEKEAFRELIKKGMLINANGVTEEEENFEEAIRSVNTVLIPTQIPLEVKQIFEDEACIKLVPESKPFWIIVRAVKDFVESDGNGFLPLRGTIPDMTADSERYIQLQNIYRDQANKDCDIVTKRVRQLLHALGKPQDCVSDADIRLFCKNAAFMRVIRCRSLAEEYNTKTIQLSEIMKNSEDPDSEIIFYILLRTVDRFYTDFSRYPGYYNDQVEPDIVKLKSCLGRILQEWNCGPLVKDDYVHEMCRYGAAELHSVAAFIGGVAAHEVIKLVTNQYIPFNNTYIYNGMMATSATFQL